jgi:predicted secreted hydrolase
MLKLLFGAAAMAALASTSAQEATSPAMAAARAALVVFAQKDVEGFASAREPWRFSFPADHASHAQFRTESWRFSGTLATSEGRRFGFLLVFFRVGVTPPATPLGPSAWAAREVYWTQFAVTDAAADRRYEFEKLERGAMGLSGAQSSPARVWVHEWSAEAHDASRFSVRAAHERVSIALSLAAAKPPVTRTAGSEQAALANTFHAYLVTRLHAKGTLQIGERTLEVAGIAWLDRAWGEVPLPVGAVVWDRFLVQLDDGRDVMGVRLRRRDGSADATVSGLMVEREGAARTLQAADLAIDRAEGRWRLRLPGENVELYLNPYVGTSGPAGVSGALAGHAYIELAADAAGIR